MIGKSKTTYTCNLACRSCSPAFSSKWVIINNNLSKEGDRVNMYLGTPLNPMV